MIGTRRRSGRLRAPVSSSVRFALRLGLVFILGAVVAGWFSYTWYERKLDALLWQEAQDHALALKEVLDRLGPEALERQIAAYSAAPRSDMQPVLFEAPGGGRAGNLPLAGLPFDGRRLLDDKGQVVTTRKFIDQGSSLHAFGIRDKSGWIVAARDSRLLVTSRVVFFRVAAWSLAGAVLLVGLLGLAMARRDGRRLRQVDETLHRAMQGDLAARIAIPARQSDDVAWISQSVNEMLSALETSISEMREVSSALAHDLRRPLQRVRTRLEPHVLSDDMPETAREDLEQALSQLEELNRSFDAILRLSRLESGVSRVARDPVDLRALALDTVELLEPVAEDRQQTLQADAKTPVAAILGDEAMLRQALINLVENAIQYGPVGNQVIVRVWAEGPAGEHVNLSVCDTGPGIPADLRDLVLKRFVRLDETRANAGTGLGLSMVAAIVRRHGGQIQLGDNAPGLCARLTFDSL